MNGVNKCLFVREKANQTALPLLPVANNSFMKDKQQLCFQQVVIGIYE